MAEKILRTEYSEEMQKSYMNYSMSVITARAIPDARDGLKPVPVSYTHLDVYKRQEQCGSSDSWCFWVRSLSE